MLQSSKSTNMLRAFCTSTPEAYYVIWKLMNKNHRSKPFFWKHGEQLKEGLKTYRRKWLVDPYREFMNINDKVQILAKSTKQWFFWMSQKLSTKFFLQFSTIMFCWIPCLQLCLAFNSIIDASCYLTCIHLAKLINLWTLCEVSHNLIPIIIIRRRRSISEAAM